ncbi:MAG: hypothetical protein ACLFNO_03530 [Parcubacteria group bacterium]
MTRKTERVLLIVAAVIITTLAVILLFQYFGKGGEKEVTETVETEQSQPEDSEQLASQELKQDLQKLSEEKGTAETQSKTKITSSSKSKPKTDVNSNPYGLENYSSWLTEAEAVPASSVTFKLSQGKKPNLSSLNGDMGTILVPLAVNSKNYVAIMYLKKRAIAKMSKHVKDLNPNVVPMTNSPENSGQKWTIDASGEVFFFKDQGQQFVPNSQAKAAARLDCYLGKKQVKENGQMKTYEIWLGWEVSTLNDLGVLELNPSAAILHRPADNGKVLVNVYQGVSLAKK